MDHLWRDWPSLLPGPDAATEAEAAADAARTTAKQGPVLLEILGDAG